MNAKSDTNNLSSEAASSANAAERPFADGDLGRVQGLLFGDQFELINARIDALEAALAAAIADMKVDLSSEIDATKAIVDQEISDRIEAVETVGRSAGSETTRLQRDLEKTTTKLDKAVATLKTTSKESLAKTKAALREEMTVKISQLDADLRDNKVDRHALAALLTTTANELAGTAPADAADQAA